MGGQAVFKTWPSPQRRAHPFDPTLTILGISAIGRTPIRPNPHHPMQKTNTSIRPNRHRLMYDRLLGANPNDPTLT
eukprot:3731789-Pyramimonas_sp.AAC.1